MNRKTSILDIKLYDWVNSNKERLLSPTKIYQLTTTHWKKNVQQKFCREYQKNSNIVVWVVSKKKEWVQETIENVSGYLFSYKLDFELIWNLLVILLKYFLLNNDSDNVPSFLKYKFLKNWIIFTVLFVKSKNIIILTTSCGTPPNSQKLFLSLENS